MQFLQGRLKLSTTETYKGIRPEQDRKTKQPSVQIAETDNVKTSPSEHSPHVSSNDIAETSTEPRSDNNKNTTISDIDNDKVGNDINNEVEVPSVDSNEESTTSSANDHVKVADSKDDLERPSTLPSLGKGIEISNGDHPADAEPKVDLVNETTSTVNLERPESETVESHSTSNTQENEKEILPELSSNMNKQQEHKTDASPMKVQDQLDEVSWFML